MHRRELLHTVAAAAGLSFLPRELEAAVGFTRRLHAGPPPRRALPPALSQLVSAMAELIIPETDTPGATAVGVPAFIEHIVGDWMSDAERANLTAGLGRIDDRARAAGAAGFATLAPAGQIRLLQALDGADGPDGSAEKAYARIKQLTTYGYFTSEPVMTKVLHTVIIPGRFDGCVPLAGHAGE